MVTVDRKCSSNQYDYETLHIHQVSTQKLTEHKKNSHGFLSHVKRPECKLSKLFLSYFRKASFSLNTKRNHSQLKKNETGYLV